jgi:hypothetical protein
MLTYRVSDGAVLSVSPAIEDDSAHEGTVIFFLVSDNALSQNQCACL